MEAATVFCCGFLNREMSMNFYDVCKNVVLCIPDSSFDFRKEVEELLLIKVIPEWVLWEKLTNIVLKFIDILSPEDWEIKCLSYLCDLDEKAVVDLLTTE
jgi:hypothetical protein